MQFQRDLACLARRAAVMDRGIDASRCVGPAALRPGRVCGDGGAARGTRAGRRAWGGGRASSCASPRRCARRTSERGPRRFSEAPRRSGAPARQRSCGRGGRARPRVRGAAGAARTSGARRPSRRRERRTISRRSFLPRASRAPVSASLARTRAAGRVPSRPREFSLLVIQLLTHQFRSTRPCPRRSAPPQACFVSPAAPQSGGSECNKSGRRRSAPR